MAFIPAARVAQCEVRFQVDGQNVENTLYFQNAGTVDATNLLALATYLDGWYDIWVKPLQNQSVVFREVYCVDLTTQTGPTATSAINAGDTGGNVAPSGPNNVTIAISFRTAGRGRSTRGRNFWIGLSETDYTLNTVDGGTLAAIIEAYDELRTNPPTDWTWGVLSRYFNNAPRASGLFQPITAVIATDDTVDSQRKRLPGRGT